MKKTKEIAREIAIIAPIYLRNIYPFVLKAIDLPPSQIIALVTIDERKMCTLGDLSKAMHVSAPTITGIIDRMEKSGYVKRIPNKKDRRITNIALSTKGQKAVHRFRDSMRIKWESILEMLPSEDQENWLRIFKNITEGLDRNAQ